MVQSKVYVLENGSLKGIYLLNYYNLVNVIELDRFAHQISLTSDQLIATDINCDRASNLSQLKPRIVDAVYTHGS